MIKYFLYEGKENHENIIVKYDYTHEHPDDTIKDLTLIDEEIIYIKPGYCNRGKRISQYNLFHQYSFVKEISYIEYNLLTSATLLITNIINHMKGYNLQGITLECLADDIPRSISDYLAKEEANNGNNMG